MPRSYRITPRFQSATAATAYDYLKEIHAARRRDVIYRGKIGNDGYLTSPLINERGVCGVTIEIKFALEVWLLFKSILKYILIELISILIL